MLSEDVEMYACMIDYIPTFEEGLWERKDGTTIKISDMSTAHIQNTIELLEALEADCFDDKIKEFKKELKKRDKLSLHEQIEKMIIGG